jgi:hypothetical protein
LLPYHIVRDQDGGGVEAWAGYPLQFSGQRRFPWQDDMANDLRAALATPQPAAGDCLAGTFMTTDPALCDVENRLFTNPGATSFPKRIERIRFERGVGPPPGPPVAISAVAGHLYFYRYRWNGIVEWWEPDTILARWERIPRFLPDDGSCRPVWLALKQAAARGEIDILEAPPSEQAPLGIRVNIHATPRGPRSAPVVSETVVDGVLAAFHSPPPSLQRVTAALTQRLSGTSAREIEHLLGLDWPGILFRSSAFIQAGTHLQISPCDERCLAGEVSITVDSRHPQVEISGELFTLRRR